MTAPLNWSQLQQNAKGALDPVPDGEYLARLVDVQTTKSSTDKLMYKTKWEIVEGPHVKRRISSQMVVSDDSPVALAIFFRQCEAMGLDGNFFAQNPTPDQVGSAMLNRQARITLGHRVWQGIDRNEVKGILPPLNGGPAAPGVVTGPATLLPSAGATGPGTPTPTSPGQPSTPATPASTPSTGPKPPAGSAPPLPI